MTGSEEPGGDCDSPPGHATTDQEEDVANPSNTTDPAPGTEVANRQKAQVAIGGPQGDLDSAYRYSSALAQSSLVPDDLKGKPSNVLVILLYGQELDMTPMQAIQGIYVVKGRPRLAGQTWLAKIRQAGHRVSIDEHTNRSCTVTIARGDRDEQHTETYTFDDAVDAGLVQIKDGKPWARSSNGKATPWETATKRMLMWRALTNNATFICPEVALGFELAGSEPIEAPTRPSLAEVAANRDKPAPAAASHHENEITDAEVVPDSTPEPAIPDEDEMAEYLAKIEAESAADGQAGFDLGPVGP